MIERHLDLDADKEGMYSTTHKGNHVRIGHGDVDIAPSELLATAISGCSYGVLRTILDNRQITYDDIHVDVDWLMEDKKPNIVTEVSVHFKIKNPSADIEVLGRALNQTIKNCTIIQSVKSAIKIDEKLTVI
ncbi:OsmC family protein [Enterococcus mediterraneensis]|uniref:OsmC family protein n=1 Tax=Enterococcus mediterraneensis TaxID=2364791 RepID=UPI000F0651C0|nr:OsmC family protein [Enterococcus mediterraneensis]